MLLSLLTFGLVWYTAETYQQLTFEDHRLSIQELLKYRAEELIQSLRQRQVEFADDIQSDEIFRRAVESNDTQTLKSYLHRRFNQPLLDKQGIHFKSILLRDSEANMVVAVYDDNADSYNGCPVIIDRITTGGNESNQKSKFALCAQNNDLMSEVVVRTEDQDSASFIHIIAYLGTELKSIDKDINLPVTIMGNLGQMLYQSPGWLEVKQKNKVSTPVLHTLYGDDLVPGLVISSIYSESPISSRIESAYSTILIVAGTSTFGMLLFVLIVLFYSFKPVDKVRQALGVVENDRFVPINIENLRNELKDFASAYNKMILILEDASLKHDVVDKNLRSERDFISKTLNSITDAVLVVNSELILKLANPAAEKMLGERQENLNGYALDTVVTFYTNRSVTHIVNWEKLRTNPQHLEKLYFEVEGKVSELEVMISPMLDVDLEDVGYVLIFRDVTEDRRLRRRINYESRHDKVTGLLIRDAFESKYDELIAGVYESTYQHVLVVINIDHFNVINQGCGNQAGDLLLHRVAKILRRNVRKSDFLARIRGDEFSLILAGAELSIAAGTVNNILADICKSGFNWDGVEYPVTASAALMTFSDSDDDLANVLSRLSSATSLAKQKGGNQYYLVGDDDINVQEHHSNLSWVAKINKGFVEKRFKLFAQPIVPVDGSDDKRFYEVLIRYQDEDGSLVQPGEFLGAARRFSLSEKIDRWVISEVIHWVVKNPEPAQELLISINISEASITSNSFHRFLFQILQTDLVNASSFCFEATESSVVKDTGKSIEFIKQLKTIGAKFSLDDFGSGISSLTHLQQFPLDYLKIDGVYVENILQYDYSSVFVSSIVTVGHSMGVKVIAESVESKEVWSKLSEVGVDYLQGSVISNPEALELIDFNQPS